MDRDLRRSARRRYWVVAMVGLAALALLAIGAAALSGSRDLKRYRIPTHSMAPALRLGAIVTVDPHSRTPRIGDIIAFHPPAGADAEPPVCGAPREGGDHRRACGVPTTRESHVTTFIKRVVAGPGDVISIVHGRVIRNGTHENVRYVTPCDTPFLCDFPVPITIPPGEYFVLGDNRGESDDSRFCGPVPRSWIVGTVVS